MKIIRYLLSKFVVYYLKFFNRRIKIKENVFIDFKSNIHILKGTLILHENVKIRSYQKGYHTGMPFPSYLFIDFPDAVIEIGKNSRINGVSIHAKRKIIIGNNCVIASGVHILDSNGHILRSSNRTSGIDKPGEIIIGDNVWIGLNAIILKNTIIGNNSVVAAGSVVQGVFPDNSIISGNPAILSDSIKF